MSTASDRQASPPTQTVPAIVIFGASMQLRYANQRARDLIEEASGLGVTTLSEPSLPLEIIEVGTQLREQLNSGNQVHEGRRVEVSKTITIARGMLRLHAFGIPDPLISTPLLIMVVIEESCHWVTAEK
jgi:hypothetical protein